ncbi:UDP-N-acetylglucosamine 1-carboxyvinyltransferase [Patescibacteria group bacterium]|nr:UDP-N-acetylglucosamine 1-carboxyvinyltransferase [Patescibacteria group bacterium]
MSKYIIQGKRKLAGSIKVNSSKNSALGLLGASLLNKGTTELLNFPDLQETKRIIEVLESIGVKITWLKPHHLKITPPSKLKLSSINYRSATSTRAVLLLIGPLIHYFKKFKLPKAGGCKLGARTITPYLYALENLGVKIKTLAKYYEISRTDKVKTEDIVLYESGDTVTECVITAAALNSQKTVIKYASANYQVQELCHFLQLLGVKISNIGNTTLIIQGQKSINKKVKYYLSEDPIEAMLFISLAATTNSSITIKNCPLDFLEVELLKLSKMGFNYRIIKRHFSKNKKTKLVDLKTFPSKLKALKEKIYGRPYPGLNIDNLPFFVPIATQSQGRTLIHDWVYENRAIYFTELSRLGANITLADPHRVYIDGPSSLKAAEIMSPLALRPAVIILITMLAAKGKSILRNIYSIERGYENLDKRLKALGADIKKVDN